MGKLTTTKSFARVDEDGTRRSDVQVDPGGNTTVTALHAIGIGDDSVPLPDDTAVTVELEGKGRLAVVAYLDTENEPKAEAGERRIYARKADGTVAAALWLKATGDVVFEDSAGAVVARIAADGTVHLGAETGAAQLARADLVDAEISRIWDVLTTWTVAAGDGGGALQTAATTASASVGSTGADNVRGT